MTQETQPLTIGDVLDLIAEPVDVAMNNARMWRLKDGISLDAPVLLMGAPTGLRGLAVMVSEEDGALCILEGQ